MGTGGGHGPGANFNLTTVQIVPGRNSRYVIAAAGLIDIYKVLYRTLVIANLRIVGPHKYSIAVLNHGSQIAQISNVSI